MLKSAFQMGWKKGTISAMLKGNRVTERLTKHILELLPLYGVDKIC